jgi:hypothetical protein
MSEDKREAEGPSFQTVFLKRMIPFTFLILVTLCIILYIGLNTVRIAPDQPISYSHLDHVPNGIQCLYCHTQATRSQIAGVPSVEKCMGCHTVMATENEEIQVLTGYWERGEAISWQRINDQPDFVYFSHQPHLGAGLNCETCHGNVGEMERTEVTVRMDMGWCLECHENQAPEKVAHLVDCLICHK